MNLNRYQRILLLIYTALFVYFTIIHVPYRINYADITYDTIFADNSRIVYERLGLVLFVITILTGLLYVLLKNFQGINVKFTISDKHKNIAKRTFVFVVVVGLIGIGINNVFDNIKAKKQAELKRINDIAVRKQQAAIFKYNQERERKENEEKLIYCSQKQSLFNFYEYFKFKYPEYKIASKPKILRSSECTYQISFTTLKTEYGFTSKDVVVMEIKYSSFDKSYHFETIRGSLY